MPKNKPSDLTITGAGPAGTDPDGTKSGTDSHVAGHEENEGADD